MGWTCPDDCRYHCTHRVTNDAFDRVNHIKSEAQQAVQALASIAASDGSQGFGGMSRAAQKQKYEELVESRLKQLSPVQKQMVQYHGKWVFIRFLGAQEPLSVIFSLLNLWVHSKGVVQLRSQLPDLFPLKVIYILHALVSCNAWIWSAVFHARDKGWTEKLDYFSAGAVILSGLFFSICRLFRIPPSHPNFTLLARVCAGALAVHILYLSIGRFDYSYNMTANVLVGLAHTFLWLAYSLRPSAFPGPNDGVSSSARSAANGRANEMPPNALSGNASSPTPILSTIPPPSSSRTARIRLQVVVGLLVAATSLELLDFPPILRALDAHALWHLATVPLASMWYKWLIDDARECTSSGWWVGRGLRDPSIDVAPHVVEAMEKAKVWAVKAAATTQQGHAVGSELVARIRGFGERNLSTTFGSAVGAAASPSEREIEKAKEMGGRSHGGISV
ncbi:Predicted membrane protein [Ceraceosorus bombacis]|uniref:Post-GPI attachment to proteins factor 3 n=1 Tax=Ceraceosorus bombacis TaxID=401625 RepID=A0A0P1BR42_9BASI|nr:Predicted membrane protein [Ceraceosorus bombacis]